MLRSVRPVMFQAVTGPLRAITGEGRRYRWHSGKAVCRAGGGAIGMLPLLANVSTITPTLEAGPESDSGPLVIQHMGGWLRKWEQGAISKKAFLLAGNPHGWYAWAMPQAGQKWAAKFFGGTFGGTRHFAERYKLVFSVCYDIS